MQILQRNHKENIIDLWYKMWYNGTNYKFIYKGFFL